MKTTEMIKSILGPLNSLVFVKSNKKESGEIHKVFKCGVDLNCKNIDNTRPALDTDECIKCDKRLELE